MLRTTVVFIGLLAAAVTAHAEGVIEGSLAGDARRDVQLVYVEQVEVPVKPVSTVLDQKGNTFLPHVLPVVVGSEVSFRSSDPELHNVNAKLERRQIFNIAIPPGTPPAKRTFDKLGVVRLGCNVHKEMSAFVIVLQNPFFATPDPKTGHFRIEGLAAGTYTLRVWGEKLEPDALAKTQTVQVPAAGAATVSM